jgi:hypothetical protein
MLHRTMTVIATFAALAALAASADPRPARAAEPSGGGASSALATLTPADVVRKVEAAGYRDVRDVEYDDGGWEAEATSAAGARVEVALDPKTGDVALDPED